MLWSYSLCPIKMRNTRKSVKTCSQKLKCENHSFELNEMRIYFVLDYYDDGVKWFYEVRVQKYMGWDFFWRTILIYIYWRIFQTFVLQLASSFISGKVKPGICFCLNNSNLKKYKFRFQSVAWQSCCVYLARAFHVLIWKRKNPRNWSWNKLS